MSTNTPGNWQNLSSPRIPGAPLSVPPTAVSSSWGWLGRAAKIAGKATIILPLVFEAGEIVGEKVGIWEDRGHAVIPRMITAIPKSFDSTAKLLTHNIWSSGAQNETFYDWDSWAADNTHLYRVNIDREAAKLENSFTLSDPKTALREFTDARRKLEELQTIVQSDDPNLEIDSYNWGKEKREELSEDQKTKLSGIIVNKRDAAHILGSALYKASEIQIHIDDFTRQNGYASKDPAAVLNTVSEVLRMRETNRTALAESKALTKHLDQEITTIIGTGWANFKAERQESLAAEIKIITDISPDDLKALPHEQRERILRVYNELQDQRTKLGEVETRLKAYLPKETAALDTTISSDKKDGPAPVLKADASGNSSFSLATLFSIGSAQAAETSGTASAPAKNLDELLNKYAPIEKPKEDAVPVPKKQPTEVEKKEDGTPAKSASELEFEKRMQELAARYTLADLNRELDEVKKSTAPAGEKAKVLEKILGRIEGSSEKGTADDPRAEEQTVRDLLAQNKDLAAEQGKIFAENFWEGFKKDSTKIDAVALAAALGSPPGEPDNTYLFNFLKSQEVTQNNAGYLENRNLLIALNKAVNTSEDPAITEFKGKIGENKTPPTGLYAALALSPDGTDYDKTQKRKAAEAQAEADRKTEEWTNWLYEKGKPFGIERGRAGISHEGVEGAFYGGKGVVSEVAKTFKPITSHLSNPYENPYHWMFNLAAVGVGWALAYKVIKNIPVIGSGIIGPALALAVGYAAWSYLSGSGGMFYNPDGPTKKSSVTQQFKSSANETTTEGLKKPVSVDIDAGNAKLIEARLENGGLGQRADTTHTPLHFRSGQLVQQIKGTGETASAPYLQAVDFDGKPVAFTTLLHRESTAAQGAQHLPASMRADGIDASTGDRHMPRAAGMTTDISLDRPVTSELSL